MNEQDVEHIDVDADPILGPIKARQEGRAAPAASAPAASAPEFVTVVAEDAPWSPDMSNPLDRELAALRAIYSDPKNGRPTPEEREEILRTARQASENPEVMAPEDLIPDRATEYQRPLPVADPALGKELASLGTTLGAPRPWVLSWVSVADANLRGAEPSLEQDAAADEHARRELRKVWGGAYEQNIALLNEVLEHYPRFKKILAETRLDQNVSFMREALDFARAHQIMRVAQAAQQ